MSKISMKALLESGVHFGHRTHRWNPNMKPYIFTERNGIHILDLQQTVKMLDQAYKLVQQTVADGGTILFVGTKRQAHETIKDEAIRCEMPYVSFRWLGGMLTNWTTMRQRIMELDKLERMREKGELDGLTKKERLIINRKIDKLNARFGGVRNMHKLPDIVFVIDIQREETAVKEANTLGIPILALVDTNCDPREIDHVIPSNDDAIRAIKLMVAHMANAVLAGKDMRKDDDAPSAAPIEFSAEVDEISDEDLLGASTIAKVEAAQAEEAVVEETVETEEAKEEVVEEKAEAVAEEKIEEVVEETTEEKAKEVVEETTEEKAEEVVEETTEEKVEEVVEETTEEKVEEVVEETTEEKAEEVVEEAKEEVAEEKTEEATDEATEETPAE